MIYYYVRAGARKMRAHTHKRGFLPFININKIFKQAHLTSNILIPRVVRSLLPDLFILFYRYIFFYSPLSSVSLIVITHGKNNIKRQKVEFVLYLIISDAFHALLFTV